MLSELHCPYCGSGFELELPRQTIRPTGASDHVVEFGALRCACYRYPIVAGIPILQQRDGLERVLTAIDRADGPSAVMEALNLFRITWARKSRLHQVSYKLACRRLLSDDGIAFERAVDLVRKPKGFADYLFHRWANPSFLAATAAMAPLGQLEPARSAALAAGAHPGTISAPHVLDLACGAGHSSYLMRLLYPQLHVISADHDFVSLYLARRYHGADGTFVCIDAETPSPFPAAFFQGIFCLDAFHYLRTKRAIVQELKRVAAPDALWLFPHLHNALQENITPGVPLAPEKYLELFEFAGPRLYDDMRLLRQLSETGRVDLRAQTDLGEVRRANALTLVAGAPGTFVEHEGHFHRLAARREALAINPIYQQRSTHGGVLLQLDWPNPVMQRECSAAEAVLPATLDLTGHWQQRSGASDDPLRELLRRFVVVPLPARYRHAVGLKPWGDAPEFEGRAATTADA